MKYYFYGALSWPQLLYVAQDTNEEPPGSMCNARWRRGERTSPIEPREKRERGSSSHRKMGLAAKLRGERLRTR